MATGRFLISRDGQGARKAFQRIRPCAVQGVSRATGQRELADRQCVFDPPSLNFTGAHLDRGTGAAASIWIGQHQHQALVHGHQDLLGGLCNVLGLRLRDSESQAGSGHSLSQCPRNWDRARDGIATCKRQRRKRFCPWKLGDIHIQRERGRDRSGRESHLGPSGPCGGRNDRALHTTEWAPERHETMPPPRLTPQTPWHKHEATQAGMVKWYHTSLPSSWCGFDSRYPLQPIPVGFRRLVTISRLECRMVERGTE